METCKALLSGQSGLATARLFISEGAEDAITGRDQQMLDEEVAELRSKASGQGSTKQPLDQAFTEALPRITPDNAQAWFRLALNGPR